MTSGAVSSSNVPMEKVNLAAKFGLIHEPWQPRIAGELNDSFVKLVKISGEFIWHRHEIEDELFLVVKGTLRMRLREDGTEREIRIEPGEFLIVPHGVEHLPSADEDVHAVLLEPKSTLNTGDQRNERTVERLQRV